MVSKLMRWISMMPTADEVEVLKLTDEVDPHDVKADEVNLHGDTADEVDLHDVKAD